MLDTHVGSMGIGGVDYLSGVKKTFLAIFGYEYAKIKTCMVTE